MNYWFFSRHPKCLSLGATTFLLMAFARFSYAEYEYQRVARIVHNQYRARHSSRSLYSTKDLNRRAEKCAHYYANLGNIDHSCPYVYDGGENIWANWGGRPTDSGATLRSIDGWYAEEKFYSYRGRQSGTGHFTQLVWRDTKAMGFGVARVGHMTVAVGVYWPAGNYNGEYNSNVWRPYHKNRYKYG